MQKVCLRRSRCVGRLLGDADAPVVGHHDDALPPPLSQFVATAAPSAPGTRLGFVSSGADGAMQLHFHVLGAYAEAVFHRGVLPCETSARVDLLLVVPEGLLPAGTPVLRLSRSSEWPLPFLVIEAPGPPLGSADTRARTSERLAALAHATAAVALSLETAAIPHHAVVSDGGRSVFIFPLRRRLPSDIATAAYDALLVSDPTLPGSPMPRSQNGPPLAAVEHTFAESCGLVVALDAGTYALLDDDAYGAALAAAALDAAEFDEVVLSSAADAVSRVAWGACQPGERSSESLCAV